MKPGDMVNGYTILQPLTTAGGGQSMWTFARRDEADYFLKQFLRPTYPTPDSPGSDATKQRKMTECIAFEAHHKRLKDALSALVADGGNLIVTKAFFRHGAKYYKVTEKVDTASIEPTAVASMSLEQRVLILKTVSHSLRILHGRSIVHGDLKPGNILIKRTRKSVFTSKLIDFDNSYFEGEPPANREDIVGDMLYYSPELARYIKDIPGSKATDLTVSSDIFTLGLIFCQYLSGSLPHFDTHIYKYPWMAAENRSALGIDPCKATDDLANLVSRMLSHSPSNRPSIDEVYNRLQVKAPTTASGGFSEAMRLGSLKGSLVKARTVPPSVKEDNVDGASKLRGSLIRRREE